MKGVLRTRVGYAGGKQPSPTYRRIGDHMETIQIDYDPDRITYSQLLDRFWSWHNPNRGSFWRQYMNAVFYHDDTQRELADASRQRLAERTGREVKSKVLPVNTFTLAEDYHQKYELRRNPDFLRRMQATYPTTEGLIGSTAAARLNGYLGGNGSPASLEKEIDLLGLTPAQQENLRRVVSANAA